MLKPKNDGYAAVTAMNARSNKMERLQNGHNDKGMEALISTHTIDT